MRGFFYFCLVVLAASLVVELTAAEHEAHGAFFNSVPGGDIALGLIGGTLLMVSAKAVAALCLSRREDFYDR